MNVTEMDWGVISPEGFNKMLNQATHIYNFSFQTLESFKLVFIFITGKTKWLIKHLPSGCSHRIRIDTRGQYVSINKLNELRNAIFNDIKKQNPEIKIEIEFLI